MAGERSADKSRESGVIREIDGGAAHGLHRGNAYRMKHQTNILMFDPTVTKDLTKCFITRRVIPQPDRDDYFAFRFIRAQHSDGQFVIMILLSL